MVAVLALAALLALGRPAPAPMEARLAESFAREVVGATTRAWAPVFGRLGLTYDPPRLIFMDFPSGHPARGNAYAARVGVVVDIDEISGLLAIVQPQGRGMAALILAHEIGHHVQSRLQGRWPGDVTLPGRAHELQADCLAGWWLADQEAAARQRGERSAFQLDHLPRTLSAALQVLDALETGGVSVRPSGQESVSHGALGDRVAAIERGRGLLDPLRC